MIEVKHLDASRRKHTRVASALLVESDSGRLDVLDWSPGGMRISAVPAALEAGGVLPVHVTVQYEEVDVPFDATLEVVRRGPADGEAGLAFVTLPVHAWEMLYLVSQSDPPFPGALPMLTEAPSAEQGADVATTEEPAHLPSEPRGAPAAAPAPAPIQASEPKGAWRPPARMLVYVLVGALLAAYIGTAMYQRVWRITVESASVVAPTARIMSPADGLLQELGVAVGDRVTAGAVLFRVVSPSTQAARERAGMELAQAEIRVAELEAAAEAERARLAIHGNMVRSRIGAQRTQVGLLEERLALADAQVARVQELLGRGVGQVDLEDVRSHRATIAGQLAQTRSGLSTEERRLGAARRGFYFDGDNVHVGLPEIEAALMAARAEVALEEGQLEAGRIQAEALEITRAPFSGRVAEVLQTEGTPIGKDHLVVVLERENERLVEAWVSRQQAEYVRLGDSARVGVAGLGRTYDGTVRSIEADPAASARTAAGGGSPRVQVLLDVQGYAGEPDTLLAAMVELRDTDSVGLPAVVSFARTWR